MTDKPTILNADRTSAAFTFKGNFPSLEEMQKVVGGLIQIIQASATDNTVMVVNEEGLLLDLPYNSNATDIAREYISGNVIVMHEDLIQ